MKTTVDIADPLLDEAKALATREGITLRELVETGLRYAVKERRRRKRFQLLDARVDGRGLSREYAGSDWSRMRDAAYEGRGS